MLSSLSLPGSNIRRSLLMMNTETKMLVSREKKNAANVWSGERENLLEYLFLSFLDQATFLPFLRQTMGECVANA